MSVRQNNTQYYQENAEEIRRKSNERHENNKGRINKRNRERYAEQTPEQKQRIIDTKRIRRQIIRRIIEMDNTYTKEFFKGMKHEEVLKIEEEVKKNIENNKNTLERFWE